MTRGTGLALPAFSLRLVPVWRRNFLVWRKFLIERFIGNVADPLIGLVAFGYGMGSLLPEIDGRPYIVFLATGTVCMGTMNAAKFESLWGAFTRMHAQRTWDAILNAPLAVDDVLLGELAWAASKAAFAGLAILAVIYALGIIHTPYGLLILPLLLLAGAAFSAMALVCTAIARDYDFFTYYFTLVVMPMTFLSGSYFPLRSMPPWLRTVAEILPLTHLVNAVRPILLGEWPPSLGLDLGVLAAYLLGFLYIATVLIRRRLAA